jgi:FKBP-type peptidyl-prolyl cis-trans isomerase
MRLFVLVLVLVASAIVTPGCNKASTDGKDAAPSIDDLVLPETTDKLVIEDVVVGQGAEVQKGDHVAVRYTGRLTNGMVFDASSMHGNTPFEFDVGAGNVIKGWDEGLLGMKVGGKRKLTVPSKMGYGEAGVRGRIPRNATLLSEVELLLVKKGTPGDGGGGR